MNCTWVKLPGGGTAVLCGRTQKRCRTCNALAPLLCDGPAPNRKSKTCDAPICDAHATKSGTKDLCPECAMPEEKQSKPCTTPSTCRSCGASILWVRWRASGKRMPIDVVPDPIRGTVAVTHRKAANELECCKLSELPPEERTTVRNMYVSHFASCPNANEHRKTA